jgi:hypothetical protein
VPVAAVLRGERCARARQVVLSDELADAQRVLPALEAVATPAMRDRHWRQIFALLGLDQARLRLAFSVGTGLLEGATACASMHGLNCASLVLK